MEKSRRGGSAAPNTSEGRRQEPGWVENTWNWVKCGGHLLGKSDGGSGRRGNPPEGFNDWGGRGYDDFVPGEVTKIAPSGDETT